MQSSMTTGKKEEKEKLLYLVLLMALFSLLFEQEAPHFQFSLRPVNYVARPDWNICTTSQHHLKSPST